MCACVNVYTCVYLCSSQLGVRVYRTFMFAFSNMLIGHPVSMPCSLAATASPVSTIKPLTHASSEVEGPLGSPPNPLQSQKQKPHQQSTVAFIPLFLYCSLCPALKKTGALEGHVSDLSPLNILSLRREFVCFCAFYSQFAPTNF